MSRSPAHSIFLDRYSPGITLVEILIAITLLGLTVLISFSFVFSLRGKAILDADAEKLVAALEYARQQSIAAYQGNAYTVEFYPPSSFMIQPENTRRNFNKLVHYHTPLPQPSVTFNKLTGKPNLPIDIELESGDLYSVISISSQGLISKSAIEKR